MLFRYSFFVVLVFYNSVQIPLCECFISKATILDMWLIVGMFCPRIKGFNFDNPLKNPLFDQQRFPILHFYPKWLNKFESQFADPIISFLLILWIHHREPKSYLSLGFSCTSNWVMSNKIRIVFFIGNVFL
jgi:hypothetical protein